MFLSQSVYNSNPMGILSKLKSVLGIQPSERSREFGETTVTVEHDPGSTDTDEPAAPETTTESAVTEAEPDLTADETDDDAEEPEVEAEDDEAVESTGEPVDVLNGIGPTYAERLANAGVETVGDLAAADPDELAEATDISAQRLSGWIEQARSH